MREVWWCEEHDVKVMDNAYGCEDYRMNSEPCRIQKMLLVSPGSLVIVNADQFVGEFGLRCFRSENLTAERATTILLNMVDGLAAAPVGEDNK